MQFTFTQPLRVFQDETGLCLPIALRWQESEVELDAYLDTGATYSFFPRWIGESIGLDIEAGASTTIRTGGGPISAYLHYLTIQIGHLYFDDVPVCFAKYGDFPRNLIGRAGWLEKVRLALVLYDEQLYLSLYDEP